MKTLYLITGPAGVGKSTISKLIAKNLEKSCLIEGDDIYAMVVGSYQSAWKEGNHLEFFWKNSLDLIENSLDFGYDVVFNYIIKKSQLGEIVDRFKEKDVKIKFVLLLTDEKTLIERDKTRPLDCQMGERVVVLLKSFVEENFDPKYILDSTSKTEEQVLSEIMQGDRFEI